MDAWRHRRFSGYAQPMDQPSIKVYACIIVVCMHVLEKDGGGKFDRERPNIRLRDMWKQSASVRSRSWNASLLRTRYDLSGVKTSFRDNVCHRFAACASRSWLYILSALVFLTHQSVAAMCNALTYMHAWTALATRLNAGSNRTKKARRIILRRFLPAFGRFGCCAPNLWGWAPCRPIQIL